MFSMVNVLFDMDLCVFQSGFSFAVKFTVSGEQMGAANRGFR